MRKQLQIIEGKKLRFRATVDRFGYRPDDRGLIITTVCLDHITYAGSEREVTDHIWFDVTRTIASLNLKPGDVVEFDAKAEAYLKGYRHIKRGIDDRTRDYKLSSPSGFKKVTDDKEQDLCKLMSSKKRRREKDVAVIEEVDDLARGRVATHLALNARDFFCLLI